MTANAFSWQEWGRMDGLAIADHIRTRRVNVNEVAAQAAAAIRMVNAQLSSALEIFDDVVAEPSREGSNIAGQLFGVPFVVKDLAARLKGRKQESGCALFRDHVAACTDPFVSHLLDSGLVPIGRSTTAELGLAWDTTTTHRGELLVSRNPYDLSRTPGGSSGGSAALVAAGAVPIASTSDGGGSTRIPASHCGLVGLKPTRGLCPRPLDASEYTSRISTDGVVARSVRDVAAVLDYTARVHAGGAFMPVTSRAGDYLAALSQPRQRLRVAWSTGLWGRTAGATDDARRQVLAAVACAERLGAQLIEVDEARICQWEELWDSYTTNWLSARGQLAQAASRQGFAPEALQDLLTPMVYRMYEASKDYDLSSMWKMLAQNNRLTRQYGALFDDIDVLITPTYAGSVPLANGPSSTVHDGDVHEWFARQLDAAKYAILCNEIGAPAISIPAGLGRDGLPVGVQLCGRWGEEISLLQLAADIEREQPDWFGCVPSTHVTRAQPD